MSITQSVGRLTLWGVVIYLFVKGALVVVPRKMVVAVSALVAALVHACCGSDMPTSPAQQASVSAPIHRSSLMDARGRSVCFPEGVEHVPPCHQSDP